MIKRCGSAAFAMFFDIHKMLIKNKYLILFLVLAGVAGCKQVPMLPGVGPHKIDIQQGNAVTQEMVAKLQPGMTRNQVRFALGTPLLVDPFRTDRWDYFYSYMKRGEVTEQRRLVVYFKDDKLDRLEGDVIPAKPVPEKIVEDKVKPVAAGVKPDTVKPVTKPEIAKPTAAKPVSAEAPAAATLTTSDGTPVGSGASVADKPVLPPAIKPDAKPDVKIDAKPAVPKPDVKADEKPKEERGFFGRMLDKIGL
ncbi:MAG: outer membrane protein assembly factor BamE [Burkholderiales bacterium]